ncbi:helix-turn-helix transcriptional regulator [Spirulina sp. 06S082]|uniref:helix-turn-helix domain-containing protein n=1 Tax=Spirulina sp. 06S082 TaxID=3110248 RepID=UPI002B211B39|nr:helix-turn-helix transcriptional regulator [Spirulina sp. 06S082]MEA5468826.1 helix-turn-helix transcriptional regulator [Spirulina sp. 06S082]
MNQEFGQKIRQARKDKSYSQRDLAKLLGLDFTYLSKLENNRAEYAPKEEVIRGLARELDLDAEELIFLAGRIPHKEEDLLRQHHKSLPTLFRRLRENPEFAQKVFQEASQESSE